MKVLVICTLFPPDSSIGAIKPYMIAHYLGKYENDVTVIRYGEFESTPEVGSNYKENLEIYTVLGENSEVERFERGDYIQTHNTTFWSSLFKKIPVRFLLPLRFCFQPIIVTAKLIKCYRKYKNIKKVIDKIYDKGNSFDVVFSSYNALENIYAGEYAAKVFGAKWVMEFRDPVEDFYSATYPVVGWAWNFYCNYIHRYVIKKCDICSVVSEGIKRKFLKLSPNANNIIVIHNGYDSEVECEDYNYKNTEPEHFIICYTGGLYEERKIALESMLVHLSNLLDEGLIDRKRILFKYAGNASKEAKELFNEYSISDILEDHGYVSRDEAQAIQQNSDLFLVLSWNTKASQGVLTGKFYEGIRAGRPILSVITGDVPESELWELNKKYHYGYCYESCRGKAADDKLKEFILGMYERKFSDKGITYKPNPDLVQDFHYKNITKKLERLMLELVNEDKK